MEAVTDHEAASVTKYAKKSGRCQALESPKAPVEVPPLFSGGALVNTRNASFELCVGVGREFWMR